MNPQQMGGGLSPQDQAMLDYYLEMGQTSPEQDALQQQQMRTKMLRGMGAQQPQGQMVGRTFVKSNPLEALAPVLAQAGANYGDTQSAGMAEALRTKKVAGLDKLRQRWGMGGGMGSGQPPVVGAGPMDMGGAAGYMG